MILTALLIKMLPVFSDAFCHINRVNFSFTTKMTSGMSILMSTFFCFKIIVFSQLCIFVVHDFVMFWVSFMIKFELRELTIILLVLCPPMPDFWWWYLNFSSNINPWHSSGTSSSLHAVLVLITCWCVCPLSPVPWGKPKAQSLRIQPSGLEEGPCQ